MQIRKEQLLTEARSEILKHENKANLTEDYVRGLKGQIESQELDLRRTLEGYAKPRREHDLLHEEEADRERALRESRIGGILEVEALKRTLEMHVDEFSREKLMAKLNIINELMAKVQEVQYDVNCMNDSRDFKVAESVRSGP